MKRLQRLKVCQRQSAFTLVETMIACTAFSAVMGGIMMGFLMFNRTYALAKHGSMARLTLSDYLNLDLRRSTDFQPTIITGVTHGGWQTDDWTLPIALTVPDYNQTGGTANQPVRTSLATADLTAAQDAAITRGKLPPPTWTVTYGSATTPRLVVYERSGQTIIRREGFGTLTRPTSTTISWTWSGATPLPVQVAQGVIDIQGVYRAATDLTPADLTELPPDDAVTAFKANYTIRYVPSILSKQTTQINSVLTNNVFLRTQFYGL